MEEVPVLTKVSKSDPPKDKEEETFVASRTLDPLPQLPKDVWEYMVLNFFTIEDASNFACAFNNVEGIRDGFYKMKLSKSWSTSEYDQHLNAVREYCSKLLLGTPERRKRELPFIYEKLATRKIIQPEENIIDPEMLKIMNDYIVGSFEFQTGLFNQAKYEHLLNDIKGLIDNNIQRLNVDENSILSRTRCKAFLKFLGGLFLTVGGGVGFLYGIGGSGSGEKIATGIGAVAAVVGGGLIADVSWQAGYRLRNFARTHCSFFPCLRDPERIPLLANENRENLMEQGELVPTQQNYATP